jgi:chaperonin cofactor prefoldin
MSIFDKQTPKKLTLAKVAIRLKEIEEDFEENLENLHKQLLVIESKPDLLKRLELFKSDMESKAGTLEADIKKLRDDVNTIKDLLGLNLKKQNATNS